MKKGSFIVIEGPDGSGKTTIALRLKEILSEKYDIVHTREPGGIDIAEQIRNIILDPKNTAMEAKTEALLYAASRRQHLVEKVIPALKRGSIVLCERFVYSSLVYQGYARGLGIDAVYDINRFAIGDTMPDLVLYLDVDEKTGLSRVNSRGNKDRLDGESSDFHKKVVEGYRLIKERFSDFKVVDASRSADEVLEDCLDIIYKFLND
ncbi:MAG: dTMP kinase [Erysipelotrichaceae bacterium]